MLKPTGSHFIEIIIEDNGIGIDPNNIKKVFSMGFSTKKHGHGFGLHSSAIAAKELGGDLSLESEGEGQGALLRLMLPESIEENYIKRG